MPKFDITVLRYVEQRATIEVEADNKISALGEAHEALMSGQAFDWHNDGTADAPQIERVVEVIDLTPNNHTR